MKMKKLMSFLLCVALLMSISVPAFAMNQDDLLIARSVETLENGDYIVREVFEPAVQSRSGKTGYSTETYYNSSGSRIWDVTVTGTFTYNGTSSQATSSVADVRIYNNKAQFISKNASFSGNTARATGSVRYDIYSTSRIAYLSCDKNGNLY